MKKNLLKFCVVAVAICPALFSAKTASASDDKQCDPNGGYVWTAVSGCVPNGTGSYSETSTGNMAKSCVAGTTKCAVDKEIHFFTTYDYVNMPSCRPLMFQNNIVIITKVYASTCA
jgi:hypothetical protein